MDRLLQDYNLYFPLSDKTVKYYILYSWYLVAELDDGSRFIFDGFDHSITNLKYIDDELDADKKERKIFALKLELLMKVKSLTQTELAKELGMSQGSIFRYLNGFIPPLHTLRQLTKYFNVTCDEMFEI